MRQREYRIWIDGNGRYHSEWRPGGSIIDRLRRWRPTEPIAGIGFETLKRARASVSFCESEEIEREGERKMVKMIVQGSAQEIKEKLT